MLSLCQFFMRQQTHFQYDYRSTQRRWPKGSGLTVNTSLGMSNDLTKRLRPSLHSAYDPLTIICWDLIFDAGNVINNVFWGIFNCVLLIVSSINFFKHITF